ncbi:MAG: gamma-glutamyltransferase family protein [Conexivisphaerales archaeon]
MMCRKGVVASSHPLASFQGVSVLLKGGNVFDAAIATSAMLCVVQNNLCGLGGDTFAILKEGERIEGINGSGRAGINATIDFFEKMQLKSIPQRGPLSAVTVPGIVDAWSIIHSRYCTFELKELLAPAIEYAENGFPLTPKYVESIRASAPIFERFKGWCSIFLIDGKIPQEGYILKQKALAKSLRLIAEEGTETFYKGNLADKIVKGLQKEGGLLTHDDFSQHKTTLQQPMHQSYRGLEVYETAPNSQGAAVLLWLKMLEEFPQLPNDTSKLVELFSSTYKLVNKKRSSFIGDPDFLPLPSDFFSAKEANDEERLGPDRAALQQGDTTYFAVADSEGNCASIIQSNYMGFGSGIVPDDTGIVMQNRGCYFTLDEVHHNCLAPRKRTFHTLCASLGIKGSNPAFVLGSMGGDIQPQIHVQLITDIVDLGMNIQEAIDSPRWAIPNTIYERPRILFAEEPLAYKIKRRVLGGLEVQTIQNLSSRVGHAQGIMFLDDALSGGADPRGDGIAIGF